MVLCCLEYMSHRAVKLVIAAVFLLDLIVCFAVFTIARADEAERHSGGSTFSSSDDDSLIMAIMRAFILPAGTYIAYKVYKRSEDASPLKRFATQNDVTPGSSPVMNGESLATIPGDLTVPLASAGASDSIVSTDSTSSGRKEKTPEQIIFEMKRDHNVLMKKADKRMNVVMALVFVVATAMSMYSGLKCVNFHFDTNSTGLFQTFLCSIIFVIINLEYFMLKDLLGKSVEEKGEVISHLHLHPIFFDTGLKCHQCDVCHERMKGPHYIAYRCRTCDFDLCPRCYKQKDKPTAKGYGARGVRRDGEQTTTWTYFKRIVNLTMECWQIGSLAIGSLVITQALMIIAPRIQGNIFDGVVRQVQDPNSGGYETFKSSLYTYLILNVLMGFFGGVKALSQELVTRTLACTVRTKLYNSIIRMDIAFFDAMHTGQLTSRLTNDASQMVQPLNTIMNDIVANFMLLVGGAFMAFLTSWKLSVMALTVVPPITYAYRRYAEFGRGLNRSIYAAYGEANGVATEAIGNIRTVRGFSTEQHEADKYDDAIMTALGHAKKYAYVAGSVTMFSQYMNLGTSVLILWYGGTLVCDSRGTDMTVGRLMTFQLYWNMMNTAFISLGNVFNDLIRSSSAAERVFSLIDARPEVDPDAGETIRREQLKGHIEIRDVEFRYRTRPDKLVVCRVRLEMNPGTTTALVGKSGGGKSTLVHLLMRFYEPTGGSILLDGRDMLQYSSKSVRQLCGFVAQDTQLFAESVETNLAYGLGREHTQEELIAACQAANAHEFILEMEEGYDTRVGEKGVMLSGGQRQRLAIARCFLRQPRLLFLDEATSALDAENEHVVQAALDKLIVETGSTAVLIAHRLSTVINSTQIAVIHKGNIVERGTHDELVEKGGVYAQLVKRQMSRDASSCVEDRKNQSAAKGPGPKGVQTEIDELIEEMEANGTITLDESDRGK